MTRGRLAQPMPAAVGENGVHEWRFEQAMPMNCCVARVLTNSPSLPTPQPGVCD